MLCRTLLAAAALACTLIHARSQGTQRLVQIKDLICVLLLSGVKKEELDVSILEKLQRHNVNIDDMNETLRQQCSTITVEVTQASNVEITVDSKPTTIEANPPLDTENKTTLNLANDLKMSDINTILKYYIANINSNSSAKINKNNVRTNEFKPYVKNNIKVTTAKYIQKDDSEKSRFLNTILKLWDNFKSTTTSIAISDVTTEMTKVLATAKDTHEIRQDQLTILVDDVKKNSPSNVMKTLQEYLSQKESPVQSKQLKDLKRSIILADNSVNMEMLLSDIISKQIKPKIIELKRSLTFDEDKTIEYKQPKQESYNIINLTDRLHELLQKITQKDNKNTEPIKPKYNKTQNQFEIDESLKTTIPKGNNDQTQTPVPLEVIQEIAESIKKMVLKDLRRDISTLIPKITARNTEMTTASMKPKKPIIQYPIQMIEHIYKLFEKMKELEGTTTLKSNKTAIENSDIPTMDQVNHYVTSLPMLLGNPYVMKQVADAKINVDLYNSRFQHVQDEKYNINNHYMTPLPMLLGNNPYVQNANMMANSYNSKFQYNQDKKNDEFYHYVTSTPKSYANPYSVRQTETKVMIDPYVRYNYEPEKKKATSKKKIDKEKSNHKKTYYMAPIIQTNADEIPPLPISVARPPNMIGQTIVLTTVRTKRKKSNYNNVLSNRNKSSPRSKDRLYESDSRNAERNRINNNQSRYNNRYDKYNMENVRNRGKTSAYIRNHNSRYKDYVKQHKKLYEGERFHEQLEKIDSHNSWEANKRKESGNVKVAPRQQSPLNKIKRLRYDDTHFRNFIKTQQKVNEMLERILATKVLPETPNNGPRSVELP